MGDILKNLNNYKKVRDINFTKQDLIDFYVEKMLEDDYVITEREKQCT